MFDLSGKFVAKFGTKGSGIGEFDGPVSAAVLSDGKIVVSDFRNSRIQIHKECNIWLFLSFKSFHMNGTVLHGYFYLILVYNACGKNSVENKVASIEFRIGTQKMTILEKGKIS